MAHKVMKPISANGEIIPTGTVLDASGWRNVRALINNRYLVEVLDIAQPVVNTQKSKLKPLAAQLTE